MGSDSVIGLSTKYLMSGLVSEAYPVYNIWSQSNLVQTESRCEHTIKIYVC